MVKLGSWSSSAHGQARLMGRVAFPRTSHNVQIAFLIMCGNCGVLVPLGVHLDTPIGVVI